jgi:glycosyltransferase involved in cell wall biosynthesis
MNPMKPSRILVISHLAVYPTTAGNKIRVWTLMNNLRALGHDVWFLGLGLKPAEEEAIRKAWGDKVFAVPHVPCRNARPRLHALKRFVQDRIIAKGWATPGLDHRYWPYWDKAVRELAARESFDVVIAEYVFCSKALVPFTSAVKVIDTHDVFSDRARKLAASNIRSYDWTLRPADEARGLLRADTIIAIQKHEAAFFDRLVEGRRRILTVGHTVALNPIPPASPDALAMLFVGTGNQPNVVGIKHFIANVFPLVREKIPTARLLLAGSICDSVPAGLPGVESMGIVANLNDAYAAANVVINPLLAGTGLKTKTVEALGCARALVTTSCGAEGVEEMAGYAFLLADDPAEMAGHLIHLLESPAAAEELAQRGFRFATDWNEAQIGVLRDLRQTEGEPWSPAPAQHLAPATVAASH